jgi:hypothetical protein
LATPPVDPLDPVDPAEPAPPVACANDAAGITARLRITIKLFIETVGDLAIGHAPLVDQPPRQRPVPEQM